MYLVLNNARQFPEGASTRDLLLVTKIVGKPEIIGFHTGRGWPSTA
jgi:hypothetical protein